MAAWRARRGSRGFTLVELMVALFVMALLAVMSWRGLDAMTRAQARTEAHANEVLSVQVGLAQWAADLDAVVELPRVPALDWNGRVLRITRRSSASVVDGVLVVAWTRRAVAGSGTWLRWQSPPVTTRGDLETARQQADLWSQNPGDEQRKREVAVTPLEDWQLFYYRADAWTNPLSSDATTATPASTATAAAAGAVVTSTAAAGTLPDGVRLVLSLPPGGAVGGKLVRDWVRPTVGGGKSL